MVRERPTEWHAVSSEGPEEAVAHRFHLHVVSKHPLPGVTVVRFRGQKSQQPLIAESDTLIAAQCVEPFQRANRRLKTACNFGED
jgi:hypothetical protein